MTVAVRLSCLFMAAPLVLLAVPAGAQSFNCRKAFFADERTICEEPRLGRLDRDLATLFGHVISRLPPPQRAALTRDETAWVVARRRCGGNGRCIAGFYGRRIPTLDAMVTTPMRSEPAYPERNLAAHPATRISPPAQQRAEEKREPPAIDTAKAPGYRGNEPSATAASGSATPVPRHDFDIEPEVSPAGSGASAGSAGGPMTPAR